MEGPWKIATTDDFDAWFAAQDEAVKIEVAAAVDVLRRMGPTLGRPLVDTLNGSRYPNMKELRPAKVNHHVIRIAFAFNPRRAGILLTAGAKQGKNQQRFYEALIKKADRLYRDHLDSLNAGGGN